MAAGTLLFANHATSRLKIATEATSPTVTLPTGDGEKFPLPAVGEYFMVTLDDRRTDQIEIMRCVQRNGDVLEVIRGQEGTTAQDFLPGAVAANRATAGTFQYFQSLVIDAAGYSKAEADARFVDVAGDTMEGTLNVLPPVGPTQATPKSYIDDQLGLKADKIHTHVISDVANLQIALDGKQVKAPTDAQMYAPLSGLWTVLNWDSLAGKPTTFAPAPHTHPTSQVNGLDAAQAAQDTSIQNNTTNIDTLFTQKLDNNAPSDGFYYGRYNGTWAKISVFVDAPMDNAQYARQSGNWSKVTGNAITSDVPPSNPLPSSFWWENDTGALYLYYDDGSSKQWVQVNSAPGLTVPAADVRYVKKTGDTISGAFQGTASLFLTNPLTTEGSYAIIGQGAGNTGGVLGLSGLNSNIFGILGFQNYGLWVNGPSRLIGSLNVDSIQCNGGASIASLSVSGGANFSSQVNFYNITVGYNTVYGGYGGGAGGYGVYGRAGAGYGGVIGYSYNQSYYGILGHQDLYTVYGNGRIYTTLDYRGGDILVDGWLHGGTSGSSTTTNSPTAWIGSNGTIYRSTSSLEYKTGVEPLEDQWADKVLQLKPIYYHPGENTMDRTDWSRYGFGAEECFAVDPRFAVSDKQVVGQDEIEVQIPDPADPEKVITQRVKGDQIMGDEKVVMHDLNAIVAALLHVVKRQQARIEALEAR